MLRTFNYSTSKSNAMVLVPFVNCGTFETRSTRTTIDDHYSFYSDITDLKLYLLNERSNFTCSSPLFQHVTNLLVEIPIIKSSWWNNLSSIGKKQSFYELILMRRIHFISYKKERMSFDFSSKFWTTNNS